MLRLSLLTISLAVIAAGLECTHPFIPVGGRCVYIDPWQTGTMAQVRAICKSHGGDIIWFDGDGDCDFYRELLTHIHENGLNEKDYWMGITDEGHDADWRYLKDNKPVRDGPPFWNSGFPTVNTKNNCAYFRKAAAYYWQDVACTTTTLATICRDV